MGKRLRVMIVDDHRMVREGIQGMLEDFAEEIEVAGTAASAEEGVALAVDLRPDVVFMDLRMPGMGGIEAIKALHGHNPEIRVVALTTFDDEELIFGALSAGAIGYLLKDADAEDLVLAAQAAVKGDIHIASSIASKMARSWTSNSKIERPAGFDPVTQEMGSPELSERERDILRLLALGCENEEIAGQLYISVSTVKKHVMHIYERLGLTSRAQAALKAVQMRLVTLEECLSGNQSPGGHRGADR